MPIRGERLGVALPQVFTDGKVDAQQLATVAERAENLGFTSLWTQEQLMGTAAVLDPLTLLSYVSAITRNIGLGVSVLALPQHNPIQLAKRLATLDQLSGGRLTVGVGIGSSALTPEVGGIPRDQPARRLMEGLEVMLALWDVGDATFEGAFWQLRDIPMNPKPVQRPRPALWFGGRHPNALWRAVQHGDGWMGAGASPRREFERHVAELGRILEDAGREPGTFTVAKRMYIAVDDGSGGVKSRFEAWFSSYYGDASLAGRAGLCGRADRIREWMEETLESGADFLLLNPVFDFDRHLEEFGRWLER